MQSGILILQLFVQSRGHMMKVLFLSFLPKFVHFSDFILLFPSFHVLFYLFGTWDQTFELNESQLEAIINSRYQLEEMTPSCHLTLQVGKLVSTNQRT